ncbi:hypothetical protein [Mucilaginibacter hurinus]|nr:hypothetical protein [Mucilaginibacter hurinus]
MSSNTHLMMDLLEKRSKVSSAFGADRSRYGDLYYMCFLPQYKSSNRLLENIKPDSVFDKKREINLYAICNSYLLSFIQTPKVFAGVKKYWQERALNPQSPVLDTTQKNILLLQVTERSVMMFLYADRIIKNFKPHAPQGPSDTLKYINKYEIPPFPLKEQIFSPRLNEALEFNLFDYRFITPVKELKATINHKFFGRISPGVVISPDNKYLFLSSTVKKSAISSSFYPLSDAQINKLIASFNKLYTHYKEVVGFDEVYLSIIPNPVTIVAPEMDTYNNLLPRIQQNPDLKVPTIDVYEKFKQARQPIYQYADTHWNNRGLNLWLEEVNKKLINN